MQCKIVLHLSTGEKALCFQWIPMSISPSRKNYEQITKNHSLYTPMCLYRNNYGCIIPWNANHTLAQYQPASQGLQVNKVWPSSDDHQLCVACSKTEEGWLVVFGHVTSLRVDIYTTHSNTTACPPKVCALFWNLDLPFKLSGPLAHCVTKQKQEYIIKDMPWYPTGWE